MVMDKKDSNIITNIFACEILFTNAASWTFYKTSFSVPDERAL